LCGFYLRAATIREWYLLNPTSSWEDKGINCLKEGGVVTDTREVIRRDAASLATYSMVRDMDSDLFV